MSALPKPNFTPQYYPHQAQIQPKIDQNQKLAKPQQKHVKKVVKNRNFPQQNRLPQKLQLLSLLQKSSFGLALVSLLASIGLYASTVKIPELWSQEYRNLENLQRQERELIAINEKIKYQIAQEASQDDRLSISKPESAVFIAPAKANLKNELNSRLNHAAVAKIRQNNLGY